MPWSRRRLQNGVQLPEKLTSHVNSRAEKCSPASHMIHQLIINQICLMCLEKTQAKRVVNSVIYWKGLIKTFAGSFFSEDSHWSKPPNCNKRLFAAFARYLQKEPGVVKCSILNWNNVVRNVMNFTVLMSWISKHVEVGVNCPNL